LQRFNNHHNSIQKVKKQFGRLVDETLQIFAHS